MQNREERFIRYDEETKYLLDFIHQWEEEHPEDEMVFITLPKRNQEERERILQTAIKILSKEDFTKTEKETNS